MSFADLISNALFPAEADPVSQTDLYVVETMLEIGASAEEIAGRFQYALHRVLAIVDTIETQGEIRGETREDGSPSPLDPEISWLA